MLTILPEVRLIRWIWGVILLAETMYSDLLTRRRVSNFEPDTKILKRFSLPEPMTVEVEGLMTLVLLVATAYTSCDAWTALST